MLEFFGGKERNGIEIDGNEEEQISVAILIRLWKIVINEMTNIRQNI